MMRALLILAAAVFVIIGTAPAFAQCGPRETIVAHLEKTYGEIPKKIGVTRHGSKIETLVSPSGTFTIILTRPNGLSCVMVDGDGYEDVSPPPGAPA